jgi:ATP phosphoribosyltransferase regulatory subunit
MNGTSMSSQDQWLLPEGIEEVLPPEARRLECARRELLDLFDRWGYALIFPPFIEYLESLLTGTGNDLDLQTFKLTDQLTGRMMGVRADITPQAARIDAHPLRRDSASRLCYLGTVLHTRPDGFAGSRSPLQVGAELFGHAGVESDVEILSLVLESLSLLEIPNAHVDLGHVGIFRALAAEAGLSKVRENDLCAALQRKAVPEIEAMLADWELDTAQRNRLAALAELNGGPEVLEEARRALAGASDTVIEALDNLCAISVLLQQRVQDVVLHFDLAELRGYKYQTGMVFAVFIPGCGQEIARGGRYDAIGEVFGRARPATGFSTDLKTLVTLSQRKFEEQGGAILAPADNDPALFATVQQLRRSGERVVCALPGDAAAPADCCCNRILVNTGGTWTLKPV